VELQKRGERKLYEIAELVGFSDYKYFNKVYKKYTDNSGDKTKTVIASTASPFKFTRSVMDAIDKAKYDSMTDFELVDELSKIANVAVPQAIEDIRTAPVIHNRVCDRTQMEETVRKILGV